MDFREEKNPSIVKRFIAIPTAFLIIIFYLPAFLPIEKLWPLILEDGLFEWIGSIFFLMSSILFLSSFLKSKDKEGIDFMSYSWWYIALASFFFVAFGEEISWGQRVFGLETPEVLQEVNVQQEINIHNLKWVFGDTGMAAIFSSKRIFMFFCLLFLLIVPILAYKEKFKVLIEKLRIPVLPLSFGILFLANTILQKLFLHGWFGGNEDMHHALSEIMETNMGLIIFTSSLYLYLLRVQHKHSRGDKPKWMDWLNA